MTTQDFAKRAKQHDQEATKILQRELHLLGAVTSRFGIELDDDDFRSTLRGQHDPIAKMLRFRPDMVVIFPGGPTLFCEMKSGSGNNNYAVAMNSYEAGRQWHGHSKKLFYAFVDVSVPSSIQVCWYQDLPFENKVIVPTRGDYQETISQLERDYPGVGVTLISSFRGSGEPFFLVRRTSKALLPLETIYEGHHDR